MSVSLAMSRSSKSCPEKENRERKGINIGDDEWRERKREDRDEGRREEKREGEKGDVKRMAI